MPKIIESEELDVKTREHFKARISFKLSLMGNLIHITEVTSYKAKAPTPNVSYQLTG